MGDPEELFPQNSILLKPKAMSGFRAANAIVCTPAIPADCSVEYGQGRRGPALLILRVVIECQV